MTKIEIDFYCISYGIKNYTINDDMSIDVNGNVYLSSKGISSFVIKFNKVSGNFDCSWNKIFTLYNSPNFVGGNFNCGVNNLLSLEYGPYYVGGDYICSNNYIENLYNSPNFVGGNFNCVKNNISFIDGFNTHIDKLIVDNKKLLVRNYKINKFIK